MASPKPETGGKGGPKRDIRTRQVGHPALSRLGGHRAYSSRNHQGEVIARGTKHRVDQSSRLRADATVLAIPSRQTTKTNPLKEP